MHSSERAFQRSTNSLSRALLIMGQRLTNDYTKTVICSFTKCDSKFLSSRCQAQSAISHTLPSRKHPPYCRDHSLSRSGRTEVHQFPCYKNNLSLFLSDSKQQGSGVKIENRLHIFYLSNSNVLENFPALWVHQLRYKVMVFN